MNGSQVPYPKRPTGLLTGKEGVLNRSFVIETYSKEKGIGRRVEV